jgi:hypothetical protein
MLSSLRVKAFRSKRFLQTKGWVPPPDQRKSPRAAGAFQLLCCLNIIHFLDEADMAFGVVPIDRAAERMAFCSASASFRASKPSRNASARVITQHFGLAIEVKSW